MNAFVIIFLFIASIFAIGVLVYVTVDVVLEIRNRTNYYKEEKIEAPIPELESDSEIEIIESEPVLIPADMPEPVSAEVGIEVIDVAWPESMAKNKIYKYDPNGETVNRGDMVLVPTFDKHRHGDIFRTATVINGNYRVDSLPTDMVLKQIVRVIK
ncbi:MAG: hypothetical protein IKB51_05265 [Clostridia bacterium]|nr:hypothetical protein [Clostridia bacterium]